MICSVKVNTFSVVWETSGPYLINLFSGINQPIKKLL